MVEEPDAVVQSSVILVESSAESVAVCTLLVDVSFISTIAALFCPAANAPASLSFHLVQVSLDVVVHVPKLCDILVFAHGVAFISVIDTIFGVTPSQCAIVCVPVHAPVVRVVCQVLKSANAQTAVST